MFDLYQNTARYIGASFPAIFLASLALATVDALGTAHAALGAGLAVQILLMWMFHGHFLYGDPPIGLASPAPAKRPKARFLLIFVMLLILPAVVALPIALSIGVVAGNSLVVLGLAIIPNVLAIGLFGTALPASIDRDPRYSLLKGMRRVIRTLGLLAAGPGVVMLLATIGIGGIIALGAHPSGPSAPLTNIAYTTATGVIGFFNSALTAAILCKVYRDILADTATNHR